MKIGEYLVYDGRHEAIVTEEIFDAAKIAADYTVKCIINTQGDDEHWYGAKFETALRDLMDMLA